MPINHLLREEQPQVAKGAHWPHSATLINHIKPHKATWNISLGISSKESDNWTGVCCRKNLVSMWAGQFPDHKTTLNLRCKCDIEWYSSWGATSSSVGALLSTFGRRRAKLDRLLFEGRELPGFSCHPVGRRPLSAGFPATIRMDSLWLYCCFDDPIHACMIVYGIFTLGCFKYVRMIRYEMIWVYNYENILI